MNITVTQAQGKVPVTVLKPEGRINLGNTDELFEKAKASFDQGARDMLIDLSMVESMSSAGLRTLLSLAKLFNNDTAGQSAENETSLKVIARHFKLACPQPELKNVLDISGFYQLMEIYDDLKDAIASF